MSTLRIKDLHVSVETSEGPKEILKGVNLTINSGEIHAIMGPNGSGKSTMAYALAGHPDYEITSGEAWLDDQLITEMSVDERAKAGLFLPCSTPSRLRACPSPTSCAPPRPPSTVRLPPCVRGSRT